MRSILNRHSDNEILLKRLVSRGKVEAYNLEGIYVT